MVVLPKMCALESFFKDLLEKWRGLFKPCDKNVDLRTKILKILEKLMADVTGLKAALDGISGDLNTFLTSVGEINDGIDGVLTALQLLKDQVANGGVVSQADLDAVVTQAEAVDASGEDVKAGLETAKSKLKTVV